jgi:hypothetical protein
MPKIKKSIVFILLLNNNVSLILEGSNPAFENPESMDFAGKAVAHLAADPNYFSKTGRILFTCDLAKVKSFTCPFD